MSFRPDWRLTLFVGVFLPLFLVLGVWQLNRAEQKTQLVERIEAGQQRVQALSAEVDPKAYQRYRISGYLDDSHLWLLDNRTNQGQAGYEVFAPLIGEQHWYLASLGWVAGGPDRSQLPALAIPEGTRSWIGSWRPLGESIVLAESPLKAEWPQVIQQIKPEAMAGLMGREPPRGLIQLEAGQPGVGPVIWTPTVMTPERHYGYTIQWFAMAIALFSMYLYAGLRSAGD